MVEFVEMDEDAWIEKYRPVGNMFKGSAAFNGTMFETFGEEVDYVFAQPVENVWTYISGDGEAIVQGRSLVNRIGYFVCEVPWDLEHDVQVELEAWGDPEEDDRYCEECNEYTNAGVVHECKKG